MTVCGARQLFSAAAALTGLVLTWFQPRPDPGDA